MRNENMFGAIGYYFGENKVTELLNLINLDGKPKRKRGEDDAYLMAPELGIELGFTVEEALEQPLLDARAYPDGALVLTNIEFFGRRADNYVPYKGALPDGLAFGMTKAEARHLVGEPNKTYLGEDVFKWIFDERALLCTFDGDELIHVSYQVVQTTDLADSSN